jgi:hypothetical protein
MKYFDDCLPRVKDLDLDLSVYYGKSTALFGHGQAVDAGDTLSSPRVCTDDRATNTDFCYPTTLKHRLRCFNPHQLFNNSIHMAIPLSPEAMIL